MRKPSDLGMWIRIVVGTAAMMAGVFMAAGRIDYWQGWLFSGCYAAVILLSVAGLVKKEEFRDLMKERMKPGPGTKWWDKVFYVFFIPAFLGILVIAGLDGGRHGWTGPLPAAVYILGVMLFMLGNAIDLWAMWVNTFFSSVVRIQTDRGHRVVRDGPYRYVRHPGYVGAIILGASISLVLGSLWGLVPAGVMAVALVVRTGLEDAALRRELDGYADYASEVKYRLLPGIW